MKQNNQFNEMSLHELQGKVDELRRELFTLRLNAATEHIKSFPSMQRKLRHDIARALTIARQKSISL